MRYARTYPWRRTRRFRAPSNGPDAFFVAQFSAGYTTNMFGFDLRQGQPDYRESLTPSAVVSVSAVRHVVSGPHQHWLRRPDHGEGSGADQHAIRSGDDALLSRLYCLRRAEQFHSCARWRAPLDRLDHDRLGPRLDRDYVCDQRD